MSNIKCPFCNCELVGTIGHPICRNQNCVMCDDPMPQDLLEELIRTRKALKTAVDALKLFDSGQYTPQTDSYGLKTDASRLARKALEQITALEQKE